MLPRFASGLTIRFISRGKVSCRGGPPGAPGGSVLPNSISQKNPIISLNRPPPNRPQHRSVPGAQGGWIRPPCLLGPTFRAAGLTEAFVWVIFFYILPPATEGGGVLFVQKTA